MTRPISTMIVRTLVIGVLSVACAQLIVACDGSNKDPAVPTVQIEPANTNATIPTPTSVRPTAEVQSTTPPDSTKDLVDSVGRSVTVPTNVRRVVSLNSDLTEIILALEGQDLLVSGGYRVSQGPNEAWVAGIAPELTELESPHSPAGINAEHVVLLDPDIIVSTIFGEVGYQEVLDTLEPLGVPIVITSFERLDQYWDDLRLIASALGREERGEELIAFMLSRLEAVKLATDSIPEDQRAKVYHGLWDVYAATSGDIFEHDQIEAAGGINVSEALTGFGTQVSAEQLIKWDPEIIVLLWEASAEDVLSDPKLSDIRAIKSRQVFTHPEQGWGFLTPRAIFAIEWLAKKLYPERFGEIDLDAEADEFYEEIYGVPYEGSVLD